MNGIVFRSMTVTMRVCSDCGRSTDVYSGVLTGFQGCENDRVYCYRGGICTQLWRGSQFDSSGFAYMVPDMHKNDALLWLPLKFILGCVADQDR